jgi:hypothetical protein
MARFLVLLMTVALAAVVLGQWAAWAGESPTPPEEPKDTIQGVYLGTFTPAGGAAAKIEADVIAEGDDMYRAVLLLKGMDAKAPRTELTGKAEGGKAALAGKAGDVEWKGAIDGGKLTAESKDGKVEAQFTEKKPPTLGAKPPEGAIVLLPFEEGKAPAMDEWTNPNWKPCEDGSVLAYKGDNKTKKSFGDMKLHIEIRTPYMPKARGQGRGNSGVYLQDRYEVQVLDSFGLAPQNNDMAAVYSIEAPSQYAALPPGQWQTYDIEYRAPKLDADGKKTQNANVTIVWNGVKVIDHFDIPKTTGGAAPGEVKEGPIRLQDHGNPVRFRNAWVVPLKE